MKNLILVSIVLFVVASMWVIKRVGLHRHLTISQHVARSQTTAIGFAVAGTLATFLAGAEIFFWLLPHYAAGFIAYVVFGIILFGFFTAAVVPQIEGSVRAKVHAVAAWGMCYAIPFAMITALMWTLSDTARRLTLLAFVATIVLLILFFTIKPLRKNFLLFQSGYLGIFFIFLVIVTYL